jgi:hypothetical protein
MRRNEVDRYVLVPHGGDPGEDLADLVDAVLGGQVRRRPVLTAPKSTSEPRSTPRITKPPTGTEGGSAAVTVTPYGSIRNERTRKSAAN